MKTSKLFHSVVILGMALAAEAACSDDSTTPAPSADGGASSSGSNTSSGGAEADASSDALAASDAFAGWVCCG